MTPGDLLAMAWEVLGRANDATGSMAGPIPAALLARQALEGALEGYWQQTAPGVEECRPRAQLVTLRFYIDPQVASSVRYAWYQLSQACHYNGYELAPSAAEMEHLLHIVDDLIRATEQRSLGDVQ